MGMSSGACPGSRWVWRSVTLAWTALGVAVSLKWWRESQDPRVLARDAAALRRACLGFPLPVMLRGRQSHRFTSPETGAQSLSYRIPATDPPGAVFAYYDAYLRGQGFAPDPERDRVVAPQGPEAPEVASRHHAMAAYMHADGPRAATVSVVTGLVPTGDRTVVVGVRPVFSRRPAGE
ncbi:MAG: hypothetical protein HY321_22700 [Armatimonadetes bacterium]|nr:hypothetical protein [Armatimonadota bacterium]